MAIFEQINEDIKTAMKSREKEKLEALRNIKKVMIEAKTSIGANAELSDAEAVRVISKLAKQGADSAKIYQEQGREDLAGQELFQVKVYESYLPVKMGESELMEAVKGIIAMTGASSIKDMGKVMGIAGKELAGKADGKEIAEVVKRLLQ